MTWADSNYTHKKKVTINGNYVSGSLYDFPILICKTDSNLVNCQDVGYDIKFYESSQTSQLDHQIQYWDKTTGKLIAWVKLPHIISGSCTTSAISSNTIWMYYENASETTNQTDIPNTWNSGYLAVYHMTGVKDAKGTYNLTENLSIATVTTGKIGNCYDFVSSNKQYLSHATLLDTMYSAMAWECWVNHDLNTESGGYISKANVVNEDRMYFRSLSGYANLFCESANKGNKTVTDAVLIPANTWTYEASSFIHGTALKLVRSGSQITTGDVAGEPKPGTATDFFIGVLSLTQFQYFDGKIDEVRISKVHRPDQWLYTSWSTVKNSGSFVTFGTEEINTGYTSVVINNTGGCSVSGTTTATVGARVTASSGNTQIYYGTIDGVTNKSSWDKSSSKVLRYADGAYTVNLTSLTADTGYYYRAYISSTFWASEDWANSSLTFHTAIIPPPPPASTESYIIGNSLKIFVSCNNYPNNYIQCWCKRWDEDNYNVVIETFLDSAARDFLFKNVTPGAVTELYNILGTPYYKDLTYESGNTLIFEPQYGYGLSSLRQKRTIGVKNISDTFINPNYFNVKVEGYRIEE